MLKKLKKIKTIFSNEVVVTPDHNVGGTEISNTNSPNTNNDNALKLKALMDVILVYLSALISLSFCTSTLVQIFIFTLATITMVIIALIVVNETEKIKVLSKICDIIKSITSQPR